MTTYHQNWKHQPTTILNQPSVNVLIYNNHVQNSTVWLELTQHHVTDIGSIESTWQSFKWKYQNNMTTKDLPAATHDSLKPYQRNHCSTFKGNGKTLELVLDKSIVRPMAYSISSNSGSISGQWNPEITLTTLDLLMTPDTKSLADTSQSVLGLNLIAIAIAWWTLLTAFSNLTCPSCLSSVSIKSSWRWRHHRNKSKPFESNIINGWLLSRRQI